MPWDFLFWSYLVRVFGGEVFCNLGYIYISFFSLEKFSSITIEDLIYGIDLEFFVFIYTYNSKVWFLSHDVLYFLYVPFLCFSFFIFTIFSWLFILSLSTDILSSAWLILIARLFFEFFSWVGFSIPYLFLVLYFIFY